MGESRLVCARCRTENPSSHRFCLECGQPLAAACPRCGFPAEPGARFCGGCGQPVAAPSPAPSATVDRFASPGAYTPLHLA